LAIIVILFLWDVGVAQYLWIIVTVATSGREGAMTGLAGLSGLAGQPRLL
jgi:hypothetical protein